MSVGGKSPLTGGVKESNSGGTTGLQIAYLGIKALIIEDWPAEKGFSVLVLTKDGFVLIPLRLTWHGKGVYETAELLKKRYGTKVAMSIIGPAGERKMASAGILNLDKDGVPSRINARGGLGAVMGSKGLKAIVFDAAGGQKPPILDVELSGQPRKSIINS